MVRRWLPFVALAVAHLACVKVSPGPAFAADPAPEPRFEDPERARKLAAAFPQIDAMVDAELRTRSLPGVALGVVIDGQLAHFKGAGFADVEAKIPPDADTVYGIGSITKSFTALAVLALRDGGSLALDDPLERFVSEAAGLVYPTRDAAPITLRQMLTHTSGLPRSGAYEIAGVPEPSESTITRSLTGYELESVPGTRHAYSNLGFQLLGLVVHRASGVPLRTFMARRIFEPLGMTSTSFDGAGLPPGRIAVGYDHGPNGALSRVPLGRHGAMEGAGGIFSSVRDMARYVAFQLAAYPPRNALEAGPVRRSSVREAHFNALPTTQLHIHLRPDAAKGESLVVARVGRYGYGWVIEETCELDELHWHNGGLPGYSSVVAFLPRRGVGVVVLENLGGEGGRVVQIAEQALLALQRSGGLSPRVGRAALPAVFGPAMKRFLAVYEAWNEAAYRAMLGEGRSDILEEERRELAGYRAMHGACTGYSPLDVLGPREARLALACERGALEMAVSLDGKGLITSFAGTSRGVPAPRAAVHAAERVASLIGAWDDGTYETILGGSTTLRAGRAADFEKLRAAHGACTPRAYVHTPDKHRFTLACDRGGDLHLELTLAEKNEEAVASFSISPVGSAGACPVK
jgi:CubicO group peptidase (beta-lactamase class C family)